MNYELCITTPFAFVQFTTKAFFYQVVKAVAERLKFDLVDDLTHYCKFEEQLRLTLVDTTLLHIEHGRIVELAYGGPVSALHIVGIDLKHGLCEHTRRLRGAKILVGHLRIRLLTVLANMDQSGKSADRLTIEHVFVELV